MDKTLSFQTPPKRHFDIIVVGGGTGGQRAFKTAKKRGLDALIISDHFDTTCADTGCMPSKLLLAAAHRAHQAGDAFGVSLRADIDATAVMKRVQYERDRFVGFVREDIADYQPFVVQGCARLVNDKTVEVGMERYTCEHLIIATGTTPRLPHDLYDFNADPDAFAHTDGCIAPFLTSDNIFEMPDLPKSIAVIGTGAIGLELAWGLSSLGVSVTLVGRGKTVTGLDEDAAAPLLETLSKTMHLKLGYDLTGITKDNGAICLTLTPKTGDTEQLEVAHVLFAMGRVPTLKALGLPGIGIALNKAGYPETQNPKTGKVVDKNVYILGDAMGTKALMHEAAFEGMRAIDAIEGIDPLPEAVPFSVTFCAPQVVYIGDTQTNADTIIGKVDLSRQGRARVDGQNEGSIRVFADKTKGVIQGAIVVAHNGEFIGHFIALAIANKMSVKEFDAFPFYHPTMMEGLKTALFDAASQL